MPWVKLDDQIMRNPKVRAVSRDAFALHVAGLCYAATALTDGRIPDRDLPLVAAEALAPEASAGELGEVGIWDRTDDGWQIHDYLDYQPSRDDVLAERQKARDRKRAQRDRDRARQPRHDGSHAVTPNGSHGARSGGSPPPPVPSRPVLEIPPSISGLTRHGIDPERLIELLAEHDADAFTDGGGRINNRDAWLATARQRAAERHAEQAAEIGDTFDVDTATLAEVLVGRRARTYLTRRAVPDEETP